MPLGPRRMEALKRAIVGGLYLLLFSMIIAPVLLVVSLVAGAVDIVWQFLTGKSALGVIGMVANVWEWLWGNVLWTLFGEGDFRLMPSM